MARVVVRQAQVKKGPLQGKGSTAHTKRDKRLLKGARVLVVDDDELTCRTLDRILRKVGCDVVCAHGTWEVSKILGGEEADFDAAVVDFRLQDGRGLSVVSELRAAHPPCSAVMITGHVDDTVASESIAAGADDFLLKPFAAESFLNAVANTIEKTAKWRGRIVSSASKGAGPGSGKSLRPVPSGGARVKHLRAVEPPPPPVASSGGQTLGFLDLNRCAEELQRRGGLTEREKDIAKLLLLGRSNKDIADAFGATERTAKFHVSNILEKLEVKTRTELLRFFF